MLITESEIRHHIKYRADRFVDRFGHKTSMIEELEVDSGAARIDMAFIGLHTVGIEIKSPKDSLERLPEQSTAFSRYFDYLILITDNKFIARATDIIPHWWGITSVEKSNDRIYFRQIRRATLNPSLDLEAFIKLLWKEELLLLTSSILGEEANPRKTKQELRKQLLKLNDHEFLKRLSIDALRKRSGWRSTALGANP